MAGSDNAVIYYEASHTAKAMAALTDGGDSQTFLSADELWSNASGAEAVVLPNGVISGGVINVSATPDVVAASSLSIYQSGVQEAVSAALTLAIARPTLEYIKYSIVVNAAHAIEALPGAEHASMHSDVRGEDGGPPLIPVGEIEIGQVHLSSSTPGAITLSEIKQIIGVHQERFDFPTWIENRMNVVAGVQGNAGVTFTASLPLIHTGAIPKEVFASYAEPDFAEVPKAADFVPPETTHSVASTQIYGQAIGTSSSTLNQGTFTAYLEDGISDALLKKKDENLFFKMKSNRLKTPFILCQGKFGVSRTFPAGDSIQAACTISATEGAVEVLG